MDRRTWRRTVTPETFENDGSSPDGQDGRPEGRRVDVLVVDDDEAIRQSWEMILRGAGYSVLVADDGDLALRILDEQPVGMVLLDLRMPRVDGLTVLSSLRTPQLVVLVSAFSLDEAASLDEARHQRTGAQVVTYLEKPVSPERLLSAVASTLRRAV
jgi:CheY-like chemotaxis protein